MAEEEPVKQYSEKFLKSWESTVIAFELGLTILCFGAELCGKWSWCSGCWGISLLLAVTSIVCFVTSAVIFLHQMVIPFKRKIRESTKRKINWKNVIMYHCFICSTSLFVTSVLQSLFSGMIAAFQISSVMGFVAYKLYLIHGFSHFCKRIKRKGSEGNLSASDSDDSSEEGMMGVVIQNELKLEDSEDCTDDVNQPQLSKIRRLSDTLLKSPEAAQQDNNSIPDRPPDDFEIADEDPQDSDRSISDNSSDDLADFDLLSADKKD